MRTKLKNRADDSNCGAIVTAFDGETPVDGDNLTLDIENPDGH